MGAAEAAESAGLNGQDGLLREGSGLALPSYLLGCGFSGELSGFACIAGSQGGYEGLSLLFALMQLLCLLGCALACKELGGLFQG